MRLVSTLDRRTFLLATGALALAACGSDSDGNASSGQLVDPTPDGGFILARRFSTEVLVPGTVRLPFSLANKQQILSDGPSELHGRIEDAEGTVVVADITAKLRRVNEGLVYWDFHPDLTDVGVYTLYIDGGDADGGAFQLNDPSAVTVPYPSLALPPFDTPTTADPRGVDPICTRLDGPCPFHSITLTEALATGKPVAYLIGTPAHCEIGSCAPGLEFLIAASTRLGDQLVAVHAEVYTDDSAVTPTPAVDQFQLSFEPVLFLTDEAGIVQARFDALWDQSELDEALAKILPA